MTLLTDDGREWYGDKAIDAVATRLESVAVGTGSGSEDPDSSTLANETYRNDISSANVEIVEVDAVGSLEASIEVTGGTEVPAGAKITELGVFADGVNGGGTLVWIDEFAAVTVEGGHTEVFSVELQHTR